MRAVAFIDTSVLCNLVPVPGRDQQRDDVQEEMRHRLSKDEQFILPITAVVETGNFIAQLDDGGLRRTTAQKLQAILRFICEGRSPWVLHDVPWNRHFLEKLLEGAGTYVDYVEHAQNRVGTGDLCVLTERHLYHTRTGIPATIWTLDAGLMAYSTPV
ncbi:hypothetical protein AB0H42_28225 [Nocardia sp. NPDC050799]|uniref:hypothetical protein n=1 Tax=Nocardia sp. NPDC050799 TaxID=3154842 RepID=UPI0033DA6397